MARNKELLAVSTLETVIGTGVKLKGTLKSDGDIAIDGTVVGNIKTVGNLSLGVNAVVKGDVEARNVSIAGQLDGDILAEGETNIDGTGHVVGDITSSSLGIAPGAVFIGSSKMKQSVALPTAATEEIQG